MGPADGWVTDGGLETDLIYHRGFDLPAFAAFPLLEHEAGRAALTDYFRGYADVAVAAGRPLLLETPTWRANPDWLRALGYDESAVTDVSQVAVRFLQELAASWALDVPAVLVGGVLGPRGDGYVPGEQMEIAEATDYHLPQLTAFATAGADRATALTLTDVHEAIGVARAAHEVGLPVAIGFTVETDGRLPGGLGLGEAIDLVDAAADPAYFVVNCAHPDHVRPGLE
ncbi:homocysteine S-methyltransferase family protein, partial [Nocardioides sp.]|uniref:homocysteine S-methyltransferase family protein n=1 Tax=Nocardioides sp. TaxID=35761 RepID=UPI002B26E8BD